jgi:hypothetical protein
LDGITMGGTLTLPDGEGPFPGIVLVGGSGPTDRDWCSPMLPGTNGSGLLFAEAFADAVRIAAVGALAAHAEVDAVRIAGLGNSEGTLHVLHYATTTQDVD